MDYGNRGTRKALMPLVQNQSREFGLRDGLWRRILGANIKYLLLFLGSFSYLTFPVCYIGLNLIWKVQIFS